LLRARASNQKVEAAAVPELVGPALGFGGAEARLGQEYPFYLVFVPVVFGRYGLSAPEQQISPEMPIFAALRGI
jgi:hypothetical protein